MNRYSKYKVSKNYSPFIIFSFVIISILSVSIAFSAVNTELNISGEAKFMLESDIRLTSCSLTGVTNSGFENYECKYGKDSLITGIILPSLNSTVIYDVTVTNFVDIDMLLDEIININFNNSDMEYIINGLTEGEMISGISDIIFQIIFKYKDTVTVLPEDKTLESQIKFNFVEESAKPFELTYYWDTGDISTRTFYNTAILDKDHDGTPYILAPIQHGVRAYDRFGNIVWSYTGITNGHDTRDIAVGDLQGTGYNDTVAVCSGYAVTDGWYHAGVVDRNGNELAKIRLATAFRCHRILIVGTDIFLGTNTGVTKLIKNGNTWIEDTENWDKQIGEVRDMKWDDLGNGYRLYVTAKKNGIDFFSYHLNGDLEWSVASSSSVYDGRLETGVFDSTISGKQIVKLDQGQSTIHDKDGNQLFKMTIGTNVRNSVVVYDYDGDGEDEIYISDFGQDIYVWKRTGVNEYTVINSLIDFTSEGDRFGIMNYDIDEDGEDEIILGTILGNIHIFDKELKTVKQTINIGHGMIGNNDSSHAVRLGISITDINNDGHPDLIIPGGNGYADVYINNY